ncbi:hypothetical protein FB550_112116 [Neobacillus bataviensis]|uniref:LarC family nickel insertion protein n=1 Tax=Neobacillus bataviensis TaxID=220685 RepID=A0A561CXI1_9BACI|nr:LarC family nickel insertion protein [Neobacillus bataviensis]TWD95754.1 hypothetical protein FB550_112116 [Neobacillus bataviensis]
MTGAYIECFEGVDNERLLGAWFDLGLPENEWRSYMGKIGVHENDLAVQRMKVKGIAATSACIYPFKLHGSMNLSDMEKIIDNWELPQIVKEKSKLFFQHWGAAEAVVRDTNPSLIPFDQENFAEILCYTVGNILAWHLIGEPECYVSTINLGSGWNQYDEGWKVFPEPATVQLLLGYPTLTSGAAGGITSTAAAALIRTLAVPAPQSAFITEKVGYGAGPEYASTNILRIQLGEWYTSSQTVKSSNPQKGTIVIETNIDDMNPELAGYLIQRLLSIGAMDAYIIPIIMKKGRPGLQLRVACKTERQKEIQEEIVRQTTTIGMRHYTVSGWAVPHKIVQVNTSFGELPVKIAFLDGEIVNVAPEYEACRQVAESLGISGKRVYQTVLGEALAQYPFTSKQ